MAWHYIGAGGVDVTINLQVVSVMPIDVIARVLGKADVDIGFENGGIYS